MVPQDIQELLLSGVSVLVGTRDAALMPECTRAWGIRLEDDRATATVYLTEATSGRTIANLQDNGLIAVTCCRPTDHVTCQLKGQVRRIRPADERDRDRRLRWHRLFLDELMAVGVPAPEAEALITDPVVAVEMIVMDVFAQTPGPGAGEKV